MKETAQSVYGAPRVYRISEVQKIARLGRQAVVEAIGRGDLAARDMGGSNGYRVTERALLAWLEGRPASLPELPHSASLAVLASLHEGADARFVDGVLQITHDGDPGIWHSIGSVTPEAIPVLEARWALIRESNASASRGT